MSDTYLNKTGLTYFWGKLKAWANSVFAPIVHTHASSDVAAMTGYSKPGSSSAISASDTLNQAIGKLEKGLEAADPSNAVLKNASNQVSQKEFLFRNVDNDALRIGGGSSRSKGGNILLYGKDHVDHPGRVDFQAYDGTWYSTLKFEPTETRPVFYWLNSGGSGTEQVAYLSDLPSIPNLSLTTSGSGNAVTSLSVSGHSITATKGSTFLTSASTLDATKLSGTIPSGCYTNTTYTAGTGLSLSGTEFSLASHNQASDTINLMTGYSKPSVGDAIASTDSLNDAIGKLEAKVDASLDDSNYVHKTGDETVAGLKLFDNSSLEQRNSEILLLSAPEVNKFITFRFRGNNNDNLGGLQYAQRTPKANDIKIVVHDPFGSNTMCSLMCGFDSSGTRFATAPSTSANRNEDTDIVTRGWIPNDTRIVHTTGDETIDGNKTFTTYILSSTYHTMRSTVNTSYISICGGNTFSATAGAKLFLYGAAYSTSSSAGQFVLQCTDGSIYKQLIGRPSGTLTWDGSDITGDVHTSGAETIGGAKTFTSSPKIKLVNPYIYFIETDWQKGVVPDGTSYQGLHFQDKNENDGGMIYYHYNANKNSYLHFVANCMNSASSSASTNIYVTCLADGTQYIRSSDNGKTLLGISNYRWKEIWCTQSSINSSSDKRIKQEITTIPSNILDAWENITWVQYKFNEAVDEKGLDKARLHTGLIAQDLDAAFKNSGLDVGKYGLFLYDEWDEELEEKDDKGNIIAPYKPAGNAYGLRYIEALCMEAAYMRRENARLKKRMSDLEDRLAALELRLGSE